MINFKESCVTAPFSRYANGIISLILVKRALHFYDNLRCQTRTDISGMSSNLARLKEITIIGLNAALKIDNKAVTTCSALCFGAALAAN